MASERISVLVKFPPTLLAEIDAARGTMPRMQWIIERCGAPTASLISAPRQSLPLNDGTVSTKRLTFADVRQPETAGQRLKKR